jgi:hypothetical protein
MKYSLLVVVMFLAGALDAQPGTFTVKPGENFYEVIPFKDIFRYPKFIAGNVLFRDGRSVDGRLNYNMLIKQVQFIDPKGDTLSLADEHTIRHVIIEKDTFYFSNEYVRQVASWNTIKLAESDFYKEFLQRPGSYGLASSATASNTITSILVQGKKFEVNSDQEMVLVRAKQYFIGNKFNEFFPADRKVLLKAFPRHRKKIEGFLDEHAIEVSKKEDLVKLAGFLETL